MFSIFTIHCRVSEQYSGQVRTAPGVGMWIERYQWPGGVVLKKTKKNQVAYFYPGSLYPR